MDEKAIPHLNPQEQFRRATIGYLVALGLTAILAISSYVLVDSMIRGEKETAKIINIAGRQRMLSQRIAEFAVELSVSGNQAQYQFLGQQMTVAADLMEASQRALSQGSAAWGIPPNKSPAIVAIHQADPYRLDARVSTYVGLARSYLALAPEQRAASPMLNDLLALAHQPLLESLDAAVKQYEAESEAAISRMRLILAGVIGIILLALVAEAKFIFRPMLCRLRDAQAELLGMALTDPMTGCKNRRYLMEVAAHEFVRMRRQERPLSVMMVDIDHFKRINDTYGHAVGDQAIRTLAGILVGNVRAGDLVGRIGGEEFAVVLPETTLAPAVTLAEKLRTTVAAQAVAAELKDMGGTGLSMTVSIGVSEIDPADPDFMTILKRADQALYNAKQTGRNRVIAWKEAAQNRPNG